MDEFEIPALVGDAPHVSYRVLVEHPRMPEARKLYIDRFLALYGDDPFLTRLLIETGRFLVFLLAVVLGAGHDPARRETWFTVGRLKRELAVFGMASERHIDHLVARLCAVGFLDARRAREDRRVRILQPTEKMLAHDRAWLAAHYAGLAHLCPENDYSLALNGDPNFQLAHRRLAPAFLPLSAKALAVVPETLFFLDRAAGPVIVAALLQAAMADSEGNAAIPYADVGTRFGVSRTHVRTLLVAAEARGLVRLQGRGGRRVEILPALWTAYDRSLATGMYLLDMVYAVVTGRRSQARND